MISFGFNLPTGSKVIFIPENKVYDFGYWSQTGKAIIYNEGERNMQDSFAVNPKDLNLAAPNRKCFSQI